MCHGLTRVLKSSCSPLQPHEFWHTYSPDPTLGAHNHGDGVRPHRSLFLRLIFERPRVRKLDRGLPAGIGLHPRQGRPWLGFSAQPIRHRERHCRSYLYVRRTGRTRLQIYLRCRGIERVEHVVAGVDFLSASADIQLISPLRDLPIVEQAPELRVFTVDFDYSGDIVDDKIIEIGIEAAVVRKFL